MVDLAFLVLKAANTPFYYRDLMMEIAKIKEYDEKQVMEVIAQLYTEINIDGRFACVGTNLWGLKRWYPLEKAEDPVGNTLRPRIINDEDDDDDDDAFEEEVEDFETDEKTDDDYDGDEDTDDEVDEVDEADEVDKIDEIDEVLDDEDLDEDLDEDIDEDLDEDEDSDEDEDEDEKDK